MSAQVTITQLPTAGAITGTELVPIVQNGVTVQTTTGAISASPSQTQTFLTVIQEPTLPNSRYVGATNGLSITDGGAQGLFNISTTGALASLMTSGTGIQVKTACATITGRSIAVSGAGLSIADGSGVSGDPTLALSGQVANFANASFNGLVALSTAGSITSATVTGTASQIDVANGTGVSGNPTISLASDPVIPGTGGVVVPAGTTGQRGTSTLGNFRYNSSTGLFEGYNGAWTAFASGSGVTSVATGTGLTGGPITSTGTISLANTSVVAGTYTASNITVDAQGRITAAANGSGGGGGTVTSIDVSGGTTGLTTSGGPITTAGTITLAGTLDVANGGTGQTTASAAFNALSPVTTTGDLIIGNGTNSSTRLGIGANGYLLTSDGTTATWAAAPAGGVTTFAGGTTGLTPASATSGAVTLAGTLVLANGGSGQTTAQAAMNAFAGAVTSGSYLRGDGTNVVMNTIQVADVPTLNQNTTGTAANVTGTVAIANGGTGQVTAAAAITALTGTQTVGQYLRSDGTNAALAAIQAGDVPTLNQNTTGTAANVTGTVAVANGGTGQTSYTDGEILIGNTTGNTLAKATLTAGCGVTITNGAGAITISASGGSVCCATPTVAGIVYGKTALYVVACCIPSGGQTALGTDAGLTCQGINAVAIGTNAGLALQGSGAVAIGYNSGSPSVGCCCVPLAGQGLSAVAIGDLAGQTAQKDYAIAIGYNAGNGSAVPCGCGVGQGINAIAIGRNAGLTQQGSSAIAIGYNAGGPGVVGPTLTGQGCGSVAIGASAGQGRLSCYAVAVGFNAAKCGAAGGAVVIGNCAGLTSCANVGYRSVAIGVCSGRCALGNYGVGIGYFAGYRQGCNAIAIGTYAGLCCMGCGQPTNSIVINATGVQLVATGACQTHIGPIRNATTCFPLYYNPSTREITYG